MQADKSYKRGGRGRRKVGEMGMALLGPGKLGRAG